MNNGSHEIDRNSGVVGDLPPTIFKYYDYSIRSLLNLKKQVIHFGSPARFNDPYDCATSAQIINPSPGEVEAIRRQYLSDPRLPEPDRRQLSSESQVELGLRLVHSASEVLDAQRERFLATRGVSCFSERNDDLRMWAQYGDCYGGFCLEFRSEFAPFSKLQRVRYSEQAPSVALDELLLAKDYSAIFQRMYCTKSIAWAHEQEWRCFHGEVGTDYTYATSALKAVYFGPRIERQALEIVCLILGGQNKGVQCQRRCRSDPVAPEWN